MATQTSSQDLYNLTINRVTSPEAFEQMINAGVISANEFYLIEGENETVDWSNITNPPSTFPPESHSHGNITDTGTVSTTAAIGNGDKLAIIDNSDSSKITGSTISFDGSTATKALTQKGTWETFNNYSLPTAADDTLGGIKTNYSTSASEKNYAIKVDGNGNAYVNVPWTDNNTTSFTITANATDGLWDLTGTSGTNAVTYALAPYSSKKTSASFYTGTTNPTLTTRLNYDGYLYATKLYSGGSEVLTSHQSLDNYKTKQTAITDSTGTSETSTATRFVYSVSQNANGEISVKTRPLPTYNNYSLPLAASGTRGGIQIGYSESGNNYAVKLSSEKAYVTVPLDTKAPLASPALTGTPTAPTAAAGTNSTQIATTAFVANAVSQGVSQGIAANDAMVFKGTIGSTNGSVSSLPTNNYSAGWTYRVADAGTYAGDYCEVGDLIIAVADGPTSGSTITNSHWAKIEHNIDGALYKTNSVTYSGNKVLMSSGTNGAVKEGTISNADVIKTITWSAGSVPTLGTAFSIPNVTGNTSVTASKVTKSDNTVVKTISQASSTSSVIGTVTNGVLTLAEAITAVGAVTAGSTATASAVTITDVTATNTSLGTVFTVPNVTSVGTAPSLTTTTQSVITGIS